MSSLSFELTTLKFASELSFITDYLTSLSTYFYVMTFLTGLFDKLRLLLFEILFDLFSLFDF